MGGLSWINMIINPVAFNVTTELLPHFSDYFC